MYEHPADVSTTATAAAAAGGGAPPVPIREVTDLALLPGGRGVLAATSDARLLFLAVPEVGPGVSPWLMRVRVNLADG